jgi:putative serine protease PepD
MNENPRGADDADDTTRGQHDDAAARDDASGRSDSAIDGDVTYGAPPLPGAQQAPGGYPAPGSYSAPGSHAAPGGYGAPGSYGAPASYGAPGSYAAPGSYSEPGGYPGQQHYGTPDAYGRQPGHEQQAGQSAPTQQYPSQYAQQNPYGAQNQYGASTWQGPAAPQKTKRNRGVGVLAATLAVGLLAGGVVGGAVGGSVADGGGGTSTSAGPARDLTVNDYDDATVVTAVAAKATKSVVTITVASGSSGGTGSGVILSDDGYIVTNTHVVTLDGASASGTVSVTMSDGSILPAEVVGLDPVVDLAVLKVDASDLTPMEFADSSKLNVGDTAVAIGAPLGLSNTVTDGIVSTLNRSITVQSSAAPSDGSDQGDSNDNNGQGPFSFNNGDGNQQAPASSVISLPVIQTDASINPGNSGGALLDSDGKLIGLNVAIASSGESSGSIGVGFSIPSNLVKRVASEIREDGTASHGLLGASVDDATSDSAATQVGALIVQISQGGAAQSAGLRQGDVVTEFNGTPISDRTDLTAQVRFLAGGSDAELTYVRDGRTATAEVTLDTLTT